MSGCYVSEAQMLEALESYQKKLQSCGEQELPEGAKVATCVELSEAIDAIPLYDGSETKITSGTNINVTGTGTIGNPYIISAENVATLVDGKVPASQLPGYVDDVLEFANLAAFPATGEAGKLYTALDTNLVYRWSGTTYTEVSQSTLLTVKDEGTTLTTAATELNFVGQGIAVTNSGGLVTITANQASTTQIGDVRLATTAEAAGTATDIAVTPAGLSDAISAERAKQNPLAAQDTFTNFTGLTSAVETGLPSTVFYSYTAPKKGVMLVTATTYFSGNLNGAVAVYIGKNGVTITQGVDQDLNLPVSELRSSSPSASSVIPVVAGDVITVLAQVNKYTNIIVARQYVSRAYIYVE